MDSVSRFGSSAYGLPAGWQSRPQLSLINAVDSMGQRNTSSKPKRRSFKGQTRLRTLIQKKTPPCLGLIEDSLGVAFFLETIMESTN
jgi:hypothetical protein